MAVRAGLGSNATAVVRWTAQQQFRHMGGPHCPQVDTRLLLGALFNALML